MGELISGGFINPKFKVDLRVRARVNSVLISRIFFNNSSSSAFNNE